MEMDMNDQNGNGSVNENENENANGNIGTRKNRNMNMRKTLQRAETVQNKVAILKTSVPIAAMPVSVPIHASEHEPERKRSSRGHKPVKRDSIFGTWPTRHQSASSGSWNV